MGYCTYGDKLVPGNDQASCIGGGGNWVEDVAPIERNGVQLMHPDSQANASQLDYLTNFAGVGALGKGSALVNKAVPKFTGIPNTAKQVAQNTTKTNIFRGPAPQKLSDIGKIDPNAYKNSKAYKLDNYVFNNPIKSAAGAASVGVPAYNMFNSGEPVADKKVVQNTIANQASPMVNVEQRNARDKAIMIAKEAGDTDTVDNILSGSPSTGTDTQLFGGGQKNSMGLMGGASSVSFTEGLFNTGNTLKKDAQTGTPSKSLMDNLQSKDWWMTPTEGGGGKWDNRLFRLGEMMTHMGTPLSKQGKNPAERWTSAATSANTLNAAKAKASGSTADFWKNVNASDMNETTLLKLFTPDKGGFFGDSKIEAGQKGAARVASYVSKRAELIQGGTVPTHQEVMDALSGKKKDK